MTTSGPEFYHSDLAAERIAALLEARELTPNEVVEGLWHGSALIRRNAARGSRFVAALPDPGEAMLRIAAKDPDEGVRAAVVTAVAGGLGGLAFAMPILYDALLDKGEGIRDTAIQGLEGRLTSDPLALPYLVEALGDLRPAVSGVASQLLVRVGGERAASALVSLLGHGDAKRRRTAYDVLERLCVLVVGELIDALRDANIRPLAAKLLAGLGELEAPHRAALERHLTSSDARLAEDVAKLLAELGRPAEPVRTEPLVLPMDGFMTRRLDEATLGQSVLAAVPLSDLLYALRDGRDVVRANAARALGLHPLADATVVQKLGPTVRDAAPEVREASLRAAGRLLLPEGIRLLLTGLEDTAPRARLAAVEGLVAFGKDGLVRALEALRAPARPTVVDGLRDAAARVGGDEAGRSALAEALADAMAGGNLGALGREVAAQLAGELGAAAEAAVPALLKLLHDPIEDVRAAAAAALGFIGVEDPVITEELRRRLADPVATVRRSAALAAARLLGRPLDDRGAAEPNVIAIEGFETERLDAATLSSAEVSLDGLVKALRDGRELVKLNAATALYARWAGEEGARAEAAQAVQPLAFLLRDASPEVRLSAARALGALGAHAAPAFWFLTAALLDPEADVREAVAEVLAAQHPACDEFLIEALRSDTDEVRRGVLRVFEHLGRESVPVLTAALANASGRIRLNAAIAVEQLADKGAEAAVPALEARLADPIGQVRAAAQAALDAILGGKPKPVVVLEPEPIDIAGFETEALSLEALEAQRHRTSAARMLRALRDGRAIVRQNAATTLGVLATHGELEPRTVVPALAVTMRDSAVGVKQAAARALGEVGRLGSHEVAPVLIHALEDKHEAVREVARTGLLGLGTAALPALVEGLLRLASLTALPPEEAERRSVLPLLKVLASEVDGDAVIGALRGALELESAPLRAGALRALRHIGRERAEALRALVLRLQGHGDGAVAREAKATLDHLDGKDVAPAAAPELPLPAAMLEGALDFAALESVLAAAPLDIQVVLKATQDGRELVRQNAARTVALLEDPPKRAAMALAILLRDSDADVRLAAAEALDRRGPAFAAPVGYWLTVALQDPEPRIRSLVTGVLAAVHEVAPEAIVEGLRVDPELAFETIMLVVDRLGRDAVPTLEAALSNPSGLIRLNAARGLELLSKRGADQAVDALKARERDPIAQVRSAAQAAIDAILGGKPRPPRVLEPDPVAIAGFDERLCEPELLERERGQTTAERMIRAISDGRPFVRHNAARVLGAMAAHGEAGGEIVTALVVASKDGVTLVRRAAIDALAKVGGAKDAHSRLVAALADRQADVREAAYDALVALGAEACDALTEGLAGLLGPTAGPPEEHELRTVIPVWRAWAQRDADEAGAALARALADDSALIRAGALIALRKVGRERVLSLRDLVVEAQRDRDEAVAREARAALDHLDGRDALPAAAPALLLPDVVLQRSCTAEELTSYAAEVSLEVLLKAAQDGRPVVRENAARLLGLAAALAGAADPLRRRAVMSLAIALRDGEREVRVAAAETLAAADVELAAPVGPWLSVALRDPDESVRDAVVQTLCRLHEVAPDALIEGLRVGPDEARETILVVVDRLGERCVPTLGQALSAPSGLIRMNAAQGLEVLAKRGAVLVLDKLEARRSDPIGQVQRFVAAAIDAIKGGRPRPPRVLEPDPIEIEGFSERLLDSETLAAHAGAISPERLLRALADGRAWVRANAVTLLGVAPGDLDTAPLSVLTRDTVAMVRARAIEALALRARGAGPAAGKDAMLAVAGGLVDRHEAPRLAAQAGLAALGEDALEVMIDALAWAPNPSPAFAALVGLLSQLPTGPDAVARALAAGRPELVANALAALKALAPADWLAPLRPRAEAALHGKLGDDSPTSREHAQALLDKIDGKDIAPAALDPVPLPLTGFADGLLPREVLAEAAGELRLDLLTHALHDGRDVVRANAITGLAVLGSAQQVALPLVARGLKDPYDEARVRAAEALGQLPPRRDLAFELVLALSDRSPRVVRAAEAALTSYGEFALDAFMYALDDAPRIVGRSVLPILAALGVKALDTLVLAQRHDAPWVRCNALTALRLMPREVAKAVRPTVALARKDEDRAVRLEALGVLEWLDGVEHALVLEPRPLPSPEFEVQALEAEPLRAAIEGFDRAVLEGLLLDGRKLVRENAAAAYGLLGEPHPWLTIRLKDDAVEVQRAAAKTLRSLGERALDAAPALIESLSEDDEEVRDTARAALEELGAKALPALIEALWAPADRVRRTVQPIIEKLGADATPAIIAALDHPSQLVTLNALFVLTRLYSVDPEGAVTAMPRVIELTRHVLPAVISAAQKCLFRLEGRTPAEYQRDPVPMPIVGFDKGPLTAEVLATQAPALDVAWTISALADGRPVVRENAARAVGYMGSVLSDLLNPLTLALRDSVPEVQVAAADAFATLRARDEVAVPALTFALRDASERVRRACLVALDAYGPERVAAVLANHLVGREDWTLVTIGRVAARMSEVLVPALMRVAKDAEASLVARENAVKVLGELATKARGIEPELLSLLPNMDGMLACKAAFALGRIAAPDKQLIELMLAHLATDPRPSLHREVRESVKIIRRRFAVG